MDNGFLIKNGTVVDGTGAPPFKADVRVRNGVIVQVSQGLEREGRERYYDATDCYVTPGFIEPHNHYDGPMWWMPTFDPLPGYGTTTTINGNCGFSAAPVHDDPVARLEMVKIFSFFEDIPEKPFQKELPWDWRTWSEYKKSLERNVKLPVNFGTFVGHLAIRVAVMGLESWERAATPAEVGRMCELLEDALSAGAMGMSSNFLDYDADDRPVPTWKADDAEWTALMDVLARHKGAVLQAIVDHFSRKTAFETVERVGTLARGKGIRLQFVGGIPTSDYTVERIPQAVELMDRLRSEGVDAWAAYGHRNLTVVFNFNTTLMFAQTNNYVWGEIIKAKDDETKFAMLQDPEWRARARESWDSIWDISPIKRPEKLELFESETGAGPIGVTLREYMDSIGATHPSDALAEWVLENGSASVVRLDELPKDEPITDKLFHDKYAVGNLSDAGAHGQMFCGAGGNIVLLTEYVRKKKQLRIEEAIRIMTGQPAEHFNLHDRGTIEVGKAGDIVVFNLDEIEFRREEKRWDVPDGEGGVTYRYSRPPAPVRLTLVNGVPVFQNGGFTGKFPGQIVSPSHEMQYAEAAE